ncbi:MAG: insulinase family protein [Holophagae bacterium]|nr:insulinase family protein [Holophagae bacterium]
MDGSEGKKQGKLAALLPCSIVFRTQIQTCHMRTIFSFHGCVDADTMERLYQVSKAVKGANKIVTIQDVGGIPVIISEIPHTRAATVSIWINRGARDEIFPEEHGLTHFLEHMVFKGSATRTATDISREIERVGGDLDAFTSRDHLCFIARVPAEKLELGFELLTDMLTRPSFRPEDVKLEKSVVQEEIRMMRDDPDDSGDELFMAGLYPEAALGRSILGTENAVDNFTPAMLREMLNRCMASNEFVVSVAGRVEKKAVCSMVEPLAASFSNGEVTSRGDEMQPFFPGRRKVVREGMTATNLYMAYPLPAPGLRLQQVVSILNNVYGGGMSSRLFQKVREDSGLAYMVFSSPTFFRKEAHLYISAATAPGNAGKVLEMITSEGAALKDTLTVNEVEDGRNQLIGRLELSLETSTSKAMWGGHNMLQYNRLVTPREVLDIVRDISYHEVQELAAEIFTEEKLAALMYGNLNGSSAE